jgi:dTDP-glucose pyrophosphorylase
MNPDFLRSLIVPPGLPAIEAVARMTRTAKRIILVADSDDILQGIVTDYDVRMAILARTDLSCPVRDIMNARPITATIGLDEQAYFAILEDKSCHYIPIVDAVGKIVGVRFREEFLHFVEDHPGNLVVVMAGGLGTRLRPMTEAVPKPLLTVGGRPILFILLDQILSENFDHIYVSVHYKSEMIVKAIRDVPKYRERVRFVTEPAALGTAGALALLPELPRAPFAVVNADLLTNLSLSEMLRFHTTHGNDVTMALKTVTHTIPYGVADVVDGRVVGLREKPQYVFQLNTGAYVVSPAVLDHVPSGQPWNMTDLVSDMLTRGGQVGSFPVHEYWLDIGTPDQYERAQVEYEANFT